MKKTTNNLIVFFALLLSLIFFLDTGCIIKFITGFPCPGCGMTRAWIAFFEGNLLESFKWHPLFLLVPLLVLLIFYNGFSIKTKKIRNYILIAIAILFFATYIIRMALYFPLVSPMDYNYHSIFAKLFKSIYSSSP